MDLCHLKHEQLAEHLQTNQCRVVLRGDNVKDATRGYAVFTQPQASPSRESTGYVFPFAK